MLKLTDAFSNAPLMYGQRHKLQPDIHYVITTPGPTFFVTEAFGTKFFGYVETNEYLQQPGKKWGMSGDCNFSLEEIAKEYGENIQVESIVRPKSLDEIRNLTLRIRAIDKEWPEFIK